MSSRQIFGGILVILGIAFLIDQFEILSFSEILSTWWPLILIFIGIYTISKSKNSLLPGIVILVIGLVFQASELDWLPGGFWATFWPILLILFGISMLSNIFRKSKKVEVSEDFIKVSSIFSGYEERIKSNNFKGGEITTLFGAASLDLRNSNIALEGAELTMTAIFGGIELIVPDNCVVYTKGTPFLGGIENKVKGNIDKKEILPIVKVNYFVMFGGIEITDKQKIRY